MDLKYGEHNRQSVRVYQPPNKDKISACCIFIHGGAWRDPSNTAADFDAFGNELSKTGIICYSVDYRLSPEIKHPEHLNDVLKALKFIHSEINDFPCCLSGHSVGATLVLQSLQHSLPLNIMLVVLLDGIYDLPQLVLEYPDYLSFVTEAHKDRDWETVTFEAEELPQTNFFFVHSTADELLSPRQTKLLVNKLERKFPSSVLSVIADFGSHNSVYQDTKVRALLLEQLNFNNRPMPPLDEKAYSLTTDSSASDSYLRYNEKDRNPNIILDTDQHLEGTDDTTLLPVEQTTLKTVSIKIEQLLQNCDNFDTLDPNAKSEVSNQLRQLLVEPKYLNGFRKNAAAPKAFKRLFRAQEIKDSNEPITNIEFSPDGKYMASSGDDGVLRVYKVISNLIERINTEYLDHREHSSTNQQIASDNESLKNGSSIHMAPVFYSKPYRVFEGHSAKILSLNWSQNNFILTGSMDRTVNLWHVDRDQVLDSYELDDFVTSVKFHPTDDRFFLSATLSKTLSFWSILDREALYKTTVSDLITATCFSPNGEHLLVGTFSGKCICLVTRGLDVAYEFDLKNYTKRRHASSTGESGSKITGITIHLAKNYSPIVVPSPAPVPHIPNGMDWKVIIARNDSTIRMFSFNSRSLEVKYTGYTNSSSQIKPHLSEDTRYLISGSEDHWFRIWHFIDRKKLTQAYKDRYKDKSGTKKYLLSQPKEAEKKRRFSISSTLDTFKDGYCLYKEKNCISFHAHHSQCNDAVFAPIESSRILERSNDSIFLLYYAIDPKRPPPDLASSIIVSTDNHGLISVFRRDFAYNIKRELHSKYSNVLNYNNSTTCPKEGSVIASLIRKVGPSSSRHGRSRSVSQERSTFSIT
ncbi:uncharacterized protein PAS_chr1-1_0471 [Komagataella phaffii GS115]|uniref:Alpha/beta hydrolase fold-3 domain-containing protein n=2 Tax=Komagataella phaffii TaxID=460519 RepID=C4QW18_KOMPG|nr:uncharacterized protein PAS_chr1-1_0471 [Komagataella phaffii GS115]CAY67441.1 hypothetical protein PAS_chr1-1_0471 [Komagataella phaffii GS115]